MSSSGCREISICKIISASAMCSSPSPLKPSPKSGGLTLSIPDRVWPMTSCIMDPVQACVRGPAEFAASLRNMDTIGRTPYANQSSFAFSLKIYSSPTSPSSSSSILRIMQPPQEERVFQLIIKSGQPYI